MIATIILPALVALIGLLLYALSTNQRVAEIGRLTYLAGILVTTYVMSGHAIHF